MQKPDFTGEWRLNVKASSLSPVIAPVVQSGFVRIQHREPTVSVHLSITMDGKPVDVRFERPSGWDGDTLVFADKVSLPNGEMTICFATSCRMKDVVFAQRKRCGLPTDPRTTCGCSIGPE